MEGCPTPLAKIPAVAVAALALMTERVATMAPTLVTAVAAEAATSTTKSTMVKPATRESDQMTFTSFKRKERACLARPCASFARKKGETCDAKLFVFVD